MTEKEQPLRCGSVRIAALEDNIPGWGTLQGYLVHVYSSGIPCIKASQKKGHSSLCALHETVHFILENNYASSQGNEK